MKVAGSYGYGPELHQMYRDSCDPQGNIEREALVKVCREAEIERA